MYVCYLLAHFVLSSLLHQCNVVRTCNAGNKELVKNADKFWWFGHMWNHYQPHLAQTKEQLVSLMKQNYDFAAVSKSFCIV